VYVCRQQAFVCVYMTGISIRELKALPKVPDEISSLRSYIILLPLNAEKSTRECIHGKTSRSNSHI